MSQREKCVVWASDAYFFIADRAHDAGCEQVATFDKKLLTEDGFMAP